MNTQPYSAIGRYKILSPLGSGGMGEVFLAEDTQLRRKVAIKILPKEIAFDRERLRRFEQEAYAASGLESSEHSDNIRICGV